MQRKLAAILSADVVGYSGLMEGDEAGTLERLKANRSAIFDPAVVARGGRVFKLLGDGALAEFPSVIAAVECALAIQDATEKATGGALEGERIRYRIGVNLGEVIVEGEDIYGEGVNVAARLQTLAAPGGVTLSRVVREQVEGKVKCTFEDMGEHQVKNHERPVHAFLARTAPTAAREAAPSHAATPPKVSICVLPFANMSGDSEQEYFSDGITEDVITDLSKVSALVVTARNTAFQFKGKNVDVAQVARQLKVGHVLEGSVRKSGGRVRITAQLIDATTGGHVWAERYDRDLNDIFSLQDEISQAIVRALKVKLLPAEKTAIESRGTSNPEAYDLYLMAHQLAIDANLGSARRSEAIIRICEQAIELDPSYARAWALIANMQQRLRFFHNAKDETGLAAAERAIALDPDLGDAHAAKAGVLEAEGQYDEALREVEIALRLDPESYEVNMAAGRLHYRMRRFAEAAACYSKAAAVMEHDHRAPTMMVSSYKALGDHENVRRGAQLALERSERLMAADPDNGSVIANFVGALAALGETERAKAAVKRALLLDPDNMNMRFNIACALITELKEYDLALDVLQPRSEMMNLDVLNWMKSDPDFDEVRDHPRFKAMVANAEARLAGTGKK